MRARLLLLLVVLTSAPAFAPAPFPRTPRAARGDIDLDGFQGTWRAESFETVTGAGRNRHGGWERTRVRVQGDRWTYYEGDSVNAAYRIRINRGNPSAIEFYQLGEGGALYMSGLIRRRPGRVEVLFYNVRGTAARATSFDNPPVGWWVLTLQLEGS
jgi:hypothetical protein